VAIPGNPSARLTRGVKLNTGHWLLRFSVLRETPMTSTLSIPFQKTKMLAIFKQSFILNCNTLERKEQDQHDPADEKQRHPWKKKQEYWWQKRIRNDILKYYIASASTNRT
jgi:hypothetical protein